ncbi:fatty acid synthase-like [Zophobas morio]|uniref:fatty acid synthase-like n=1 Tax=Zophobas morio TaxID=2755281 RepID=UPI00308353AF
MVQCFFMMDEAPEFDPQHSFYCKQISKNLAINIYKNKSWGTYRHLLLEESPKIICDDTYAYFKTRGDMSSFEWSEGALTKQVPLKKEQLLISTYYSSINFKDIMASTGRITPEILDPHRLGQECLIGFEFSGVDLSGRRLSGMINAQGISSYVTCDSSLAWGVPDSWSLEDAATVPVVYSTVIYALLMVGNMKPGSTILIHSATGGIGLAALNLSLHYGCDIYVTVGTQEKREYLRKNYPQISDRHMGHSRDTSFELMIKRETKSRGVDFILNSLSEDKLHASIRCLARGGQLMEIGKYDLANDNSFNSLFMEREATYHGIFLDDVFRNVKEMKSKVVKHLREGIKSGFVKPLPRIVFNADEIEKSYKYMLAGKHIGKILIKLRNENKDNQIRTCNINKLEIVSNPRFQCGRHFTYIIIGGLGGFGLELSDWLVLRGARKLVLTSRSGIQNGYHQQRINIWISYGVEVKVSTDDVTTEAGCENLIKEASTLGSVDGIFNLAVVLKIALFKNQTEENFHAVLEPKAYATLHLDRVTRKLCPQLKYFVVFSSLSCGRGHVGQSNYGMANSVMERICENRKRDGLPALAIQCGAIGEVGLLARMYEENEELVIGGTLQQKISSCLEVLDVLIKHEYPVVSSTVVAEKYHKSDNPSAVAAVAHVIGIKNMKTISQYTTFPELGMDSMMNTEIVQLLEKDFEIYVTSKDVRSLTFARLTEMEAEKINRSGNTTCDKTHENTNFLIEYIRNIENSQLAAVRLNSRVGLSGGAPIVFVLPGVEGLLKPLEYLTNSLNAHVIGVQYNYKNPEESIEEIAKNALPHIEIYLSRNNPFFLIGYSFGTLVGLEIISLLEEKGYIGTIILIDGSPKYINSFVKKLFTQEKEKTDFHTAFLSKISFMIPLDVFSQHEETLLNSKRLEQGINLLTSLIPSKMSNKLEKQAAITVYKRCNAMFNYTFKNKKIISSVHLVKARLAVVGDRDDYQLSDISENLAQVITIDGDHVTILNNQDLVQAVNGIIKPPLQLSI